MVSPSHLAREPLAREKKLHSLAHLFPTQIDASELKVTLNAMGQNPTEEEIFQMISQVDDDNSGEIEFAEFLKVIENQKASAAKANDETDTIEAFVALGGNADKTGEISTEKLRAVVKVRNCIRATPVKGSSCTYSNSFRPFSTSPLQDFGLTIDIEKLIRETDADGSGKVDYNEFKAMMA